MGSQLGFTLGDTTDGVLNTYTADPTLLVATTDRTSSVLLGDCEWTIALGQPGYFRATFYASSWTPAKGNMIELRDDGASGSVVWFAGTITQVTRTIETKTSRLLYQIVAQDYRWLLDRYTTVTKRYYSRGINSIARLVVKNFTNKNFVFGYAPESLGTLDVFEAVEERVSSVLTRLAQAAGCYWEVDANRCVNLFKTPDHKSGGAVTVSNTSNNIADFQWSDDLTDIATRVRVIAAGTALRSAVTATETSYVPVESLDHFDLDGGSAYVGTDLITYGGVTNVTGAEKLVTISGLTQDWAAGTSVRPVITVNDTSAQSTLSTALGAEGFSGIAVRTIDDASLTGAEAAALAAGDLSLLSAGVTTLTGRMVDGVHTNAGNCWPGATISVSMTSPVTLSGTWRIQRVTLRPRQTASGTLRWERTFVAGPVARGTELLDLLEGF